MNLSKIWILGFNLIFIFKVSQQEKISTVTSSTYTAGVVEFNLRLNQTAAEKIVENTERVVHIIKSQETSKVDILVFPEAILNSEHLAFLLPDLNENHVLCEDSVAHPLLRSISCAVKEAAKYVVINLYIRMNCETEAILMNNIIPWERGGGTTHVYNSALVFDRSGAIIAIYRKYHLFNEPGVDRPLIPDYTTFKTDFNVTFGIFTCFDIMFKEPAITLVNAGVKHFIFPSMWFSELPYLTAIQIQQSWAYTNNVNLLAAGVNRPSRGSTGSGIYAEKSGVLEAFLGETPATKVLIANVHRVLPDSLNRSIQNEKTTNVDLNDHRKKQNPSPISEFDVWSENLDYFNITFLDLDQNNTQIGMICHNQVCCSYNIEVSYSGNIKSNSIFYAIAVFNGQRTYLSLKSVKTGHTICSLITCKQNNVRRSCGLRPNDEGEAYDRIQFEKLVLETEIPIKSTMIMANTVTKNLFPLRTSEFEYQKDEIKERETYAVTLKLLKPKSDLLTFAVYARDFNKDDPSTSHP